MIWRAYATLWLDWWLLLYGRPGAEIIEFKTKCGRKC